VIEKQKRDFSSLGMGRDYHKAKIEELASNQNPSKSSKKMNIIVT